MTPVTVMSDTAAARLLDDLARVPVLPDELIEAYSDGRWLYEQSCSRCGVRVDERRSGCAVCRNRHEKRRQRLDRPARGSGGKRLAAPLLRGHA